MATPKWYNLKYLLWGFNILQKRRVSRKVADVGSELPSKFAQPQTQAQRKRNEVRLYIANIFCLYR